MPVRGSPNLSLEVAIQHLTRAMRDPMSKDVCAATMGVAALRIEEELEQHASTTAKARFVNAHPDLLRAGMKFLTSNADLLVGTLNLKMRLYNCTCDTSLDDFFDLHFYVHWVYDLPEGVSRDDLRLGPVLLYAAVDIVSNCLVLSLSGLRQYEYRNGSSEDGALKWPQGPDDLFPNGLAHAYNGLSNWVMAPECLQAQHFWEGYVPVEYNIYQLISQLIAYHEPFAFSLLNYPKGGIVLVGITVCLKEAGLLHKAGKFKAFERVLGMVLNFYDAIEDYDQVQFQAIVEFTGALLQNWWFALNDVLATRPEWKTMHRRVHRLALFATNGVSNLIGYECLTGPLNDFVVGPKLTEVDLLEDAFNTIVRTRKVACLNIRCTPASTRAQTRLCSGCQVVRYCGERCQKQAWKKPLFPHKDLCAKFESLKEAIGDANWEKMWMPGFTFAAFLSMIKDKPTAANLTKCIGDTISKVVIQKNETRKIYVAQNPGANAMEKAAAAAEMRHLMEGCGMFAELEKGPVHLTEVNELTRPVL